MQASISNRILTRVWKTLQAPISSHFNVRNISRDPPSVESAGGEHGIGDLTLGEQKLILRLKECFPKATDIQVSDVSGGCGAMYQIMIEAPDFQGKRTVQQHRMVNEALEAEIKEMHGLQLVTKVPEGDRKS